MSSTASASASAAELFDDALAAVEHNDSQEALRLFNQIIQIDPNNASYHLHRSSVQLKLFNWTEALQDALTAQRLGSKSHHALYRRAVALFHLDRFEESKSLFEQAQQAGNKQCDVWLRKCEAELKEKQIKNKDKSTKANAASSTSSASAASSTSSISTTSSTSQTQPSSSVPAAAACPASLSSLVKPFQWFQVSDRVTLTEYCKHVQREDVRVEITDKGRHYEISVKLADQSVYKNQLDLWASVDEEPLSIDITAYRIEVTLHKRSMINWTDIKRTPTAPAADYNQHIQLRDNIIQPSSTNITSYPSSSKKKVDVSAVEAEVDRLNKEEKPEGEAALQSLFQTIYKDASEDTRRAMIKSFQTSGGTVLSTNWKEVKDADYEKTKEAPKGQEFVRP